MKLASFKSVVIELNSKVLPFSKLTLIVAGLFPSLNNTTSLFVFANVSPKEFVNFSPANVPYIRQLEFMSLNKNASAAFKV